MHDYTNAQLLFVILNDNHFIQLNQYEHIKSILLISSFINKIAQNSSKNLLKTIKKKKMTNVEIFDDHERMFIRLEKLIQEMEESDQNLFRTFYQQEKSLRDLQQQLGPFVWSPFLSKLVYI